MGFLNQIISLIANRPVEVSIGGLTLLLAVLIIREILLSYKTLSRKNRQPISDTVMDMDLMRRMVIAKKGQ